MIPRKSLLALAAAGALLTGCATGPYYDNYAYDETYYGTPGYRYYDYGPPTAYYPRYYGPSVGFGLSYGRSYYRRY